MTSTKIKFKTCSKCKRTLPTSAFYKRKTLKNGFRSECIECGNAMRIYQPCVVCGMHRRIESHGMCNGCRKLHAGIPNKPALLYTQNKECPLYLGVHVAERILSNVFKNVKTMPPNNPGYDFICNHGKKIDVKSSCVLKHKNGWNFSVNHNKIADHFLCIAFDNLKSLTPLHLWLIPGNVVNNLSGLSIAKTTLQKWSEYELDISKTLQCCESLK